MRQTFVIIVIFLSLVSISCDLGEPAKKSLGDSRLNGSFGGFVSYSPTPSGLYYNGTYLYISFDGTNQVWMSTSSTSYSVTTNRHSGYAEWEISNGKYRYRSWDSSASWSKWANYSFSDSNTLVIEWDPRYNYELKSVTLTK